MLKQGIDAHCHITLTEDYEQIIKESMQRINALVNVATDINAAKLSVELTKKYPNFFFTSAALHPEDIREANGRKIENMIDFIRENRKHLVGIGETGIDYFYIKKYDEQNVAKGLFEKFINLSEELHLPLVIHSRNGRDNKEGSNEGIADAIEILKKNNCRDVMMHCFSGSESQLKICLDEGWTISYATVLVKSFKHQRLAKQTLLDQMVLETDAPWLDPDSKELTNRPWKIERSAEVLSGLLNVNKEEILRTTEKNARRFFRM